MKKKITAMLLAICCISSTWTVYADDFSSGSSEVEIEITEDADADDEMFSDGTESSTSGGDISAMANQIVARAEIQAQEYQQLKKEAKKYVKNNHLDARFVPVFLEIVSEYEYNLLCEYGYSDGIIEDNGKYYKYEEIEESEDSWVMYNGHRLFVVDSSPLELGYTEEIRE